MIAIHRSKTGYHPRWIQTCIDLQVPYKIVDCYANDILRQLEGCNALLWHHSHSHPKDILFAKQLLFSLEQSGIKVFPDFKTCWHFDDKVGQKYLLEAIKAPIVPSYVFYDKVMAHQWVNETDFPKVFKFSTPN